MITDEEKRLISAIYTTLKLQSPGFRSRKEQRTMIGECASTLGRCGIALIQAETGVGKTAGYLIPSLVIAALREKRVIVSTNTVALQDQIAMKDLPMVLKAMRANGLSINVTTLKGRERYVCPVALEYGGATSDLFGDAIDNDATHSLFKSYTSGTWDGVRDSYQGDIQPVVWSNVKNSRHSCIGESCQSFNECPYYSNLQRCKTAQVVIANHDLVLSGIANNEQSIFAEYEQNIYIFDEAHHLPQKALNAFATKFVVDQAWIERLPQLVSQSGAGEYRSACDTDVKAFIGMTKALDGALSKHAGNKTLVRFEHGKLPYYMVQSFESGLVMLENLQGYATKAVAALKSNRAKASSNILDQAMLEVGGIMGKLDEAKRTWEKFFSDDIDALPSAKWIERFNDIWTICDSPFNAAPILRSRLWSKILNGVVLTSATMTPVGGFEHAVRNFGLRKFENTSMVNLESPFDQTRGKIIVPHMENGPENVEGHTKEVAKHVRAIMNLNEGGVLVLFTSDKQMRDVYKLLGKEQKSQVMVQNDLSTQAIIARHKELVDQGQPSTIFGLASFSEGLDLPGLYCTAVVIVKLPFPVPSEPILAASAEWIEKKGGNVFALVMLPAAWVKLKQSIGRLLRTEMDEGKIFMLDSRIRKPYGKNLLAGVRIPVDYLEKEETPAKRQAA